MTFGASAATGFTVNSATQITATSPAGTGTVDVRVATTGGTSATSAADQFTYVAAPGVTSISPTSGPAPGGAVVTITGTRLTGATAVKFGTTNATSFTVNSATSITATSPAGAGTVDITVTTAGGTSATSAADQFTYNGAPTVTAVSPASGPPTGGASVTVTGTNFIGVTAVKFGANNAASFTINSTTSITATAPAGAGTVDISVTTASGTSTASAADRFAYQTVATSASLASSVNPSNFGQAVTFTATVTASGGTPAGTITFKDAGSAIGTATLSGGNATFTISTLKSGTHTITAVYAGSAGFGGSTSAALIQTVNIPADSIKLRELQINVTKLVAQNSGQAISGAIDDAISEGFSSDGIFARPDQLGVRFNFAADPYEDRNAVDPKSNSDSGTGRGSIFGAGAGNAYNANGASNGAVPGRSADSRINNAFAAVDQQTPKKAAPKRFHEQQDWMFWIDVRGTGLDRLTSTTTNYGGITTTTAPLYGLQVNALAGLTYKLLPNFLVGVVGGYENFNFTEQDINGKLTGDGWTIGSYLGWYLAPALRYDAAMAYSGIAYNGTAGTAQGNFNGERWMVSTGLTGTYRAWGLTIEPSARVYALWENEGSYVDSLGTQQANHDFSTGRASGGVKLIYPFAWTDGITLAPYAGIYGDYYFDQDDATAIVAAGGVPLASTPLLEGWSARIVAGLGAKLANGAMVAFGTEYGGIGSDFQTWTLKARGQVPFDAR
ncbi:MAG TPA: IPT/TIG domain-containing protein [Acetobacteraceae bacterium]|nr:IPT/TIG domain-containing protein [Acetobacteraceae bacterium]